MRDEDNPREEPSHDDLVRLAAFIDGEGTISINRHKRRYKSGAEHWQYIANVTAHNTDKRLPDYFQRFFGGPVYPQKRTTRKSNQKQVYSWWNAGPHARYVVGLIRPFLMLKGPQADVLSEFMDGWDWDHTKRITPDEFARRERLYVMVKKMNFRGLPATTEREGASNGDATV